MESAPLLVTPTLCEGRFSHEMLYVFTNVPPNTYEASVVKRADRCIAGAGWPSE